MEEQMRTNKRASAFARRNRIPERQKHKEIMAEQREEWRKRRQRYSELYQPDSDKSRSSSFDNNSSVDSPSEDNVPTPRDSHTPDVEFNISISDLTLENFPRGIIHADNMFEDKQTGIQDWNMKTTRPTVTIPTVPTARSPVLQVNRFSTVIDSIGIDISPYDEVTAASSSSSESEDDNEEDSDTDYDYSPVEIATPVIFCVPMQKPSVISVVDTRQRSPMKSTASTSSSPSPRDSISTYNSQRISQTQFDDVSDFLKCEAEPFEVFVPASSSIISVTSSSEGDSAALDYDNVKRKSSVPAFPRFTHSRMHSIKRLIKPQSLSEVPPAVPAIPSMHHNQPSPNIRSFPASPPAPSPIYLNKMSGEYETFDRPLRKSFTEPPNQFKKTSTIHRAQTARQPRGDAMNIPYEMTKKSSVDVVDADQDIPLMKRKKSFSNLRRRSGSLGQVLKLSNDKSKSPLLDSNPPPVPIINTDNYAAFGYGPTPKPPKSSRTSGILMQSPFPSNTQTYTSVGLGLRL